LVKTQDPTTRPVDLYFIKSLGDQTTLKSDATANTYTVELNDTTGYIAGVYVGIFCPTGEYYFGHQIGVPSGDVITLDTPLGFDFEAGCNVLNLTQEMAVDGSVTPQVYQIGPVGPAAGLQVDISRITGTLWDNSPMSPDGFGGLSALPRGCVLRKNNAGYFNYINFKTNLEIALSTGHTLEMGGAFQPNVYTFCLSYAGQENHGCTIRLEPGEILELIIQDDLRGLSSFRAMAQGRLVTVPVGG
jgi:hypothetical protein